MRGETLFFFLDAFCKAARYLFFFARSFHTPVSLFFCLEKGAFGVDAVSDLLAGVLSGRVKTQALYQPAAAPASGSGVDCAALHAKRGAFGQADADAAAADAEVRKR